MQLNECFLSDPETVQFNCIADGFLEEIPLEMKSIHTSSFQHPFVQLHESGSFTIAKSKS